MNAVVKQPDAPALPAPVARRGIDEAAWRMRALMKLMGGGTWDGQCLLWTRAATGAGYGQVCIDGEVLYAHRLSYELFHGPANGQVVIHKCDRPLCFNPAHLSAGTQAENLADMRSKKRHVFGERTITAKLSLAQVDAIKADTRSQSVIAADYGINQSQVSRIKSGLRWRDA